MSNSQNPSYPNWTFKNPHLPPSIYPAWTYDNNSFAWSAKAYNQLPPKNYSDGRIGPQAPSEVADYWEWIEQQKTSPQPSVTMRGGMSPDAAFAIQTAILGTPDLKSTSISRQIFFSNIANDAMKLAVLNQAAFKQNY